MVECALVPCSNKMDVSMIEDRKHYASASNLGIELLPRMEKIVYEIFMFANVFIQSEAF